MSKLQGIIVFGANGSGKSTLGRELAHLLGFKHMDIEDYHFEKSEIPYTVELSREDCLSLMLADIRKHHSFVISAVTGDFGEELQLMYDLAVFISAPKEIRMKRIVQREYERHGDRIREGGDMYEQHVRFIDFAATRPLDEVERWAETLACPVIRVDGTEDYKRTAADIANRLTQTQGLPLK